MVSTQTAMKMFMHAVSFQTHYVHIFLRSRDILDDISNATLLANIFGQVRMYSS